MSHEKGSLSIHSENIFPIIKKWLYSDHDIFIRELVSNACDAITKIKRLSVGGEADLQVLGCAPNLQVFSEPFGELFRRESLVLDVFRVENVIAGGVKPFIFRYLIALIICYMGLSTRG